MDLRVVARTNRTVLLGGGTEEEEEEAGEVAGERRRRRRRSAGPFLALPDHGATFPYPEDHPTNPGGWAYVINSEDEADGGAGTLSFDRAGNTVGYRKVLSGTRQNCGGGRTPWGTWISCEETRGRDGHIYEVDPFGRREGRRTSLGGRFESFAYDVRDRNVPRFYVTEDHERGPLRRYTPADPDWDRPDEMLHGKGETEYLVLGGSEGGRFEWVRDLAAGEESAAEFFPAAEGIDCVGGELYFVSKVRRRLFQLDLDGGTFVSESTRDGAFTGGPDQLTRLVGKEDILYFTEDGSKHPGIHGRDASGRFFMILESSAYGTLGDRVDETSGLAFSPDGRHLYFAFQKHGIVFDAWRTDGRPFSGRTIDIKYHNLQA